MMVLSLALGLATRDFLSGSFQWRILGMTRLSDDRVAGVGNELSFF